MALKNIDIKTWEQSISEEIKNDAIHSLEHGGILYFPHLAFPIYENEIAFLSPTIADPKSKNVSYDIRKDRLAGTVCPEKEAAQLKEMLKRYAHLSRKFLERLIPHYTPHLIQAKTSFRPVEIAGRSSSYRKDDTRLHVDSFPSSPTKGQRILRVFTNVNPSGKPRIWRVGEPFENVVEKILPKTSGPIWGLAPTLKLLGITKDYRTPYDHYMLQIHDRMKGDNHYQKTVHQTEIQFPPGSTWIVYTDQVSHAAMSGQHLFEQTFNLPAHGIKNTSTNPLNILEKHTKKVLV